MKGITVFILYFSFVVNLYSQNTIEFYLEKSNEFYNQGDLNKALSELNNAKKLFKENNPNSTCDETYAVILLYYAKIHSGYGDYEMSIKLNYEAKEIINLCGGNKDFWNNIILNNLTIQYFNQGDFENCILLCKEILKLNENLEYSEFIMFSAYSTLCGAYYELMRYNEAISNANKGIDCFNKMEEAAQERFITLYVDLINNRGLNYYNVDSFNLAESDWLSAKKIIEESEVINPNKLLMILNNLSLLYTELSNYVLLSIINNEIEKILINEVEKIDSRALPYYYNNIGSYYCETKNYDKAIFYLDKAKQHLEKSPDNFKKLKSFIALNANFFELYIATKEINSAIISIDNCINYINKYNQAMLLTEEEQVLFLTKNLHFYDIYESFSIDQKSNNKEIINNSFRNNLSISNYLLRNSISMKRAISKSNDNVSIKNLNKLIELKKALDAINEGKESNNSDIEKYKLVLKDSTDQIERLLYKKSIIYNTECNRQNLNHAEISNKLNTDEALIQLNSFRYYDFKNNWTDSTLYTAYIIRKDQKQPEMVYLFEQAALDTLLPAPDTRSMMNNLYQTGDSALYNLVWKPLEPYLKGVKTAYVAPSGLLHKIAFTAVPLPDGSRLSDRYQLRQVLSGHDVVFKEDPAVFNNTSTTSVALLGGINYEYLPEAKDSVYFSPLSLLPESTDRGTAFAYLPGTESEVSSIEQLLKNDKVNVTLLKGNNANEEQFKTLQGDKAPKVLHIATHGFFAPDPKRDLNKENSMRLMGQENRYTAADNPLYRSGLLLAGGNSSWTKKTTLPADQDGVLTAYEVANMDLSNTQLVVLSACETALGDVKGREGVFGLQRGFRLAGAKYMLMSLWRIPDKETAEYMTKFYSELAKNNNIVTAYQTTQNHMKATYPNEPQIWAGMVLVE